jgi:drug/metabolite transporter (DMT)-like permease
MSPRTKAFIAFTFSSLIFGATLPLVKPALDYITPQQFLFLRYIIAFLTLTPILIITRKIHPIPAKARIPLIILELSSIGILLIVYAALNLTTSLTAALILSTRPLFTTVASILLLKEHETKMEFFGLMIAVIGTTLIITAPYANSQSSLVSLDYPALIGSGLIIITNFIAALITVGIKKTYTDIPNFSITFHHLALGALSLGLLLILTGGLPSLLVLSLPQVALPILYMAIFGSIIGLTLNFYGLSRLDASKATLFSYLQPLVYIPLGVLWLHESINELQIIGLIFTILGFLIAESRLASRNRLLSLINLFKHQPPLIQPQHV